jgi:hypothetical protein
VPYSLVRTNYQQAFPLMSHSRSTVSSSSSFQLIINNALDQYKKRTKNDLLAHPLAAQLQSCNSPSAILAILQQQFQGSYQSGSIDERWSRWLGPTVNVFYSVSSTLGANVGLVCLRTLSYPRSAVSYLSDRSSPQRMRYLLGSASSFWFVSFLIAPGGPL